MGTNGHNGHNGKNGNGHGHGHVGDLRFDGSFSPTERQRHFRDLASERAAGGVVRVQRWLSETAKDTRFEDTPVTVAEWRAWASTPGFQDWFVGALYTEEPTEFERKMMDNLFWDGVARGMNAGSDWAHKLYAGLRFKDGGEGGSEEQKKELMSWLGHGGGAKWRRTAAES